jgi:serine/threonine-protein kinase
LGKERKAYPLLQARFSEADTCFSPDMRWFAYVSDESGKWEVYVRPFPKVEKGKWQVSTDGGGNPVWARSGELFYLNGDKMMAVDVDTTTTFKAGTPRMLFERRFDPG